jgi:hypothetical protein
MGFKRDEWNVLIPPGKIQQGFAKSVQGPGMTQGKDSISPNKIPVN